MTIGNLESFTFYPSFYEAIKEIPDMETKYELMMAIMEYGNSGQEMEINSYVARAIFKTIKPNIDAERVRKENGKNGGRPRKNKENEEEKETMVYEEKNYSFENGKTMVSQNQKAIKNENENEKENENIKNTCAPEPHDGVICSTPKKDLQEQRFNEFWNLYPKKVGKEAARKSWNKVHPDQALFNKIMQSIAEAKASEQWRKQNGQFIPIPATWLNQGRWDDVIESATEQRKGGKTHEEIVRDAQGKWGAIGDWY